MSSFQEDDDCELLVDDLETEERVMPGDRLLDNAPDSTVTVGKNRHDNSVRE